MRASVGNIGPVPNGAGGPEPSLVVLLRVAWASTVWRDAWHAVELLGASGREQHPAAPPSTKVANPSLW